MLEVFKFNWSRKMMTTQQPLKLDINLDKPVPIFCRQVAAWAPDIFCNFYILKNHKIRLNNCSSKAEHILGFLAIKVYLIKLSTDFKWQTRYLLVNTPSIIHRLGINVVWIFCAWYNVKTLKFYLIIWPQQTIENQDIDWLKCLNWSVNFFIF